jgi:hypothetical protein
MRRVAALLLVLPLFAGCSSSSSKTITVKAARTYKLAGFQPAAPVAPGRPTTVSFTIEQPSGKALTKYKRGTGPHTGVHLIIVKDDLSAIIHRHPPMQPGGRFSETVVFPSAGRYRVIADAYVPSDVLPNFQLFKDIVVSGRSTTKPLGAYKPVVEAGGYRVVGPRRAPRLRAIQAAFLKFRVTDAAGKPARFVPWFGALAHAIFFHAGTLDYFHTHVCSPGATGCASILGGSKIAGKSTAPGELTVGALLPTAGRWRLFLQLQPNGKLISAPYTLTVR